MGYVERKHFNGKPNVERSKIFKWNEITKPQYNIAVADSGTTLMTVPSTVYNEIHKLFGFSPSVNTPSRILCPGQFAAGLNKESGAHGHEHINTGQFENSPLGIYLKIEGIWLKLESQDLCGANGAPMLQSSAHAGWDIWILGDVFHQKYKIAYGFGLSPKMSDFNNEKGGKSKKTTDQADDYVTRKTNDREPGNQVTDYSDSAAENEDDEDTFCICCWDNFLTHLICPEYVEHEKKKKFQFLRTWSKDHFDQSTEDEKLDWDVENSGKTAPSKTGGWFKFKATKSDTAKGAPKLHIHARDIGRLEDLEPGERVALQKMRAWRNRKRSAWRVFWNYVFPAVLGVLLLTFCVRSCVNYFERRTYDRSKKEYAKRKEMAMLRREETGRVNRKNKERVRR